MLDWLLAFVATLVIELVIVGWGSRDLGLPLSRRLLVAALAQGLTHPLVWFVFPHLPGPSALVWFWVSEAVAVLVEAAIYARALSNVVPLRAFGLSALANSVSLGAGVVVSAAWHILNV